LARDIGKALGSGGHLTGLIRTRVGDVTLGMCMKGDEIGKIVQSDIVAENNKQ
jgi:tRNA pseudouridine55 synthase